MLLCFHLPNYRRFEIHFSYGIIDRFLHGDLWFQYIFEHLPYPPGSRVAVETDYPINTITSLDNRAVILSRGPNVSL